MDVGFLGSLALGPLGIGGRRQTADLSGGLRGVAEPPSQGHLWALGRACLALRACLAQQQRWHGQLVCCGRCKAVSPYKVLP